MTGSLFAKSDLPNFYIQQFFAFQYLTRAEDEMEERA